MIRIYILFALIIVLSSCCGTEGHYFVIKNESKSTVYVTVSAEEWPKKESIWDDITKRLEPGKNVSYRPRPEYYTFVIRVFCGDDQVQTIRLQRTDFIERPSEIIFYKLCENIMTNDDKPSKETPSVGKSP